MTRGDIFRTMSNSELAEVLAYTPWCRYCEDDDEQCNACIEAYLNKDISKDDVQELIIKQRY